LCTPALVAGASYRDCVFAAADASLLLPDWKRTDSMKQTRLRTTS